MRPQVTIQTEDFNVSQELEVLRAQDLRVGAVCSFVGTVRDTRALTGQAADEVQAMELEHYPGMTEKSIEAMIEQAHQRFDFYAARVVHRVGRLLPSDQIVLVAVTSAHRDGLPQNPSSVLEKRANPTRCAVGGRTGFGRCRLGPLGHSEQ
jgi:molybdopterin synthase catalytic subunit